MYGRTSKLHQTPTTVMSFAAYVVHKFAIFHGEKEVCDVSELLSLVPPLDDNVAWLHSVVSTLQCYHVADIDMVAELTPDTVSPTNLLEMYTRYKETPPHTVIRSQTVDTASAAYVGTLPSDVDTEMLVALFGQPSRAPVQAEHRFEFECVFKQGRKTSVWSVYDWKSNVPLECVQWHVAAVHDATAAHFYELVNCMRAQATVM